MRPAPVEVAINHLSACLALVRPVGMGQAEAEEWLAVAATTLDLPEDVLADAALEARKTCTHHGQIVPAILKESEERMRWRRARRPKDDELVALPAPPPEPPTAADIHELQAIIDKAAGNFRDAELDRWAERRAERAAQYPRVKIDPDAPRTLAELTAKWDAERSGEEGGSLQ